MLSLNKVRTPFFGSQDISPISRPLAIDGAQEIISQNLPREAMCWIHTIYSYAQKVIQNDGPEDDKTLYLKTYLQMLDELGLKAKEDFETRREMLRQLTAEIMQVAGHIIQSNPTVVP